MTKHIDKELRKIRISRIIEHWDFSPMQDEDSRIERIHTEIDQLISDEVIKVLDEVEKDVKAKYERAGKGSRPSFSRDTETKGEYYSRVQGFKSACLNSLSAIEQVRKKYSNDT